MTAPYPEPITATVQIARGPIGDMHPRISDAIGEWICVAMNSPLPVHCCSCQFVFDMGAASKSPCVYGVVSPIPAHPMGDMVAPICFECAALPDRMLIEHVKRYARPVYALLRVVAYANVTLPAGHA